MNETGTLENMAVDTRPPVLVSVVVPVFNGGEDFDRCLNAIMQSDWPAFECIVVDDASTDQQTAEIARPHGVSLAPLEQRVGPAQARNTGVTKARGEIVFFTDADVLLYSDALGKAVEILESDADLAAVFGSYDDTPADCSLISRYRNLYHHWNHQIGNEDASTFWTGCGAIRKDIFLEMGGFNSEYKRPSIEDIELGYRLREAGYRIRLEKKLLCTHLKHWKFWDMLKTDIFLRGAPWVALLRKYRSAPPDLNLNWRAKIATASAALFPITLLLALLSSHAKAIIPISVLLLASALCSRLTVNTNNKKSRAGWKQLLALSIGILMPTAAVIWVADPWALLPLLNVAVILWVQRDFFRLLVGHGGFGLAIAVVPLQLLFFAGCAISVPLGLLAFSRQK